MYACIFQDVYAKYRVDEVSDWNQTKPIKDTKNPDWNFKKQHDFKGCTAEVRITNHFTDLSGSANL